MSGLLTAKENEAASDFVWSHYDRRCGGEKSAAVELIVVATGMGFGITLSCPNCKATKFISDTDTW